MINNKADIDKTNFQYQNITKQGKFLTKSNAYTDNFNEFLNYNGFYKRMPYPVFVGSVCL